MCHIKKSSILMVLWESELMQKVVMEEKEETAVKEVLELRGQMVWMLHNLVQAPTEEMVEMVATVAMLQMDLWVVMVVMFKSL